MACCSDAFSDMHCLARLQARRGCWLAAAKSDVTNPRGQHKHSSICIFVSFDREKAEVRIAYRNNVVFARRQALVEVEGKVRVYTFSSRDGLHHLQSLP